MNSLRGIFPEPPQAPRRNFIRENMLHIKRMQGYVVNDAGDNISFRKASKQLENNATQQKTMKLIRNTKKTLQSLSHMSPKLSQNTQPSHNKVTPKNIDYNARTAVESYGDVQQKWHKEIGVQTDKNQVHDSKRSPRSTEITVLKAPKNLGGGDINKRRSEPVESSDTFDSREKRDFVKENSQVRSLSNKFSLNSDPTKPPSSYQKGVVPKYLRERKEELFKSHHQSQGGDERCPEGHVILPESERKETLRMLRQSYSELVSELNQLPVRSDTLKIRNRKIEIENQLKKLDEGIKVFTRPKVYVKIGA